MCLLVTQRQPYNHSQIGYKILMVRNDPKNYFSIYRHELWWRNRLTAHSRVRELVSGVYVRHGIHIFTNLEDAKRCLYKDPYDGTRVICKVKVSGLIAVGVHYNSSEYADGQRGECWHKAKIIKVMAKHFGGW
jgi:hypothetical protein